MDRKQAFPSSCKGPLFDLSALSAVQSVLNRDETAVDPWGISLLGSFANLIIYSDRIRFSLPVCDNDVSNASGLVKEPKLLNILADSLGADLAPVPYSTDQLKEISDEGIDASVEYFTKWARRHRSYFVQFCLFHRTDFIEKHQRIRVKHGYTYNVERVKSKDRMQSLAKDLSLPIECILYAYDLSLRMPMYGEFTGPDEHYLNHPIRDAFGGRFISEQNARLPAIAITFAPAFRNIAYKLTMQEYTSTVMLLREKVREYGLIGAPPGDYEPGLLRELAASSRLPGRLRHEAAVVPILSAIVSAAIGGLVAGPIGGAFGSAVSVAGIIWAVTSPRLPGSASKISWLRWALKWDIEDQSDRSDPNRR